MFAKLKFVPQSRRQWSVSIHTPFGWTTLHATYKNNTEPLAMVIYLNALSAGPPSPAPASASTACCSPTKDDEPCKNLL